MSIKFLGTPNFKYATRGATYTADSSGLVTVPSISGYDVQDLFNAGCIPLGQSQAISNLSAVTDPGVSNDNTQDYGPGSTWFNTLTGVEWRCLSAGTGAAVWVPFLGSSMLIGRLIGANMNSASADQPFVMTQWATLNTVRPTKITCKNASTSLTTAAGGIYTAASQGGTAIVASGQAYSGLTAASLALDLTIATTPGKTLVAKGLQLYLNLTTPQGGAATADFYAWADIFA